MAPAMGVSGPALSVVRSRVSPVTSESCPGGAECLPLDLRRQDSDYQLLHPQSAGREGAPLPTPGLGEAVTSARRQLWLREEGKKLTKQSDKFRHPVRPGKGHFGAAAGCKWDRAVVQCPLSLCVQFFWAQICLSPGVLPTLLLSAAVQAGRRYAVDQMSLWRPGWMGANSLHKQEGH